MEIILYITGGIALLSVSWLMISIVGAMKRAETVLAESQKDFHSLTADVAQMKSEILPVLQGINDFTKRANSIADSVQSQIMSIQETVDDTLDVVRGTIDDVERIKNEVVEIVEGPLRIARSSTVTTASAIVKGLSLISGLLGARRNGKSH